MSSRELEALHDVHTATNDVLKGYGEMANRVEPEIAPIIRRLTEMHQRHAAEQQSELTRLRDAGSDDSSLQGTLNKAVVIVRDWVTDLDGGVLPAVRRGEESVAQHFKKAIDDFESPPSFSVMSLLKKQYDEIISETARLPKA